MKVVVTRHDDGGSELTKKEIFLEIDKKRILHFTLK